MNKFLLTLATLYFWQLPVFSQINDVHGELLKIALENNYDIKEAQLENSSETEKIKQVKSYIIPQVNGGIESTNYINMPKVYLPGEMFGSPNEIEAEFGKTYNLDAGLSASILVYNKAIFTDIKTAKKSAELHKLLEIKTKEDVVFQISYAYYYYLASQESLKILDENKQMLQENKAITKTLITSGMALVSDGKRIDIKINNIEKQIELVKASLIEQENNIRLLLGIEDYSIPFSTDSISHDLRLLGVSQSDSIVRTELLVLENNLSIHNLQIQKAKSAYRPTTSLYATYGFNAQRDEVRYMFPINDWNNVSMVGFKTSIPIFAGGRHKSKVQEAKINYQVAQTTYNQAQHKYNQEKTESILKFKTYQQNCKTQQNSVELSEDIYSATLLNYKEGLLPLTDLLIADSDLNTAKLNYTKSLLDLYMSELEVLQSFGKLYTLLN